MSNDITPLHPAVAAEADRLVDAVLARAATQVTAQRCPLAQALREQWEAVAEERPWDWALAVLRLRETHNSEMLSYADPGADEEVGDGRESDGDGVCEARRRPS